MEAIRYCHQLSGFERRQKICTQNSCFDHSNIHPHFKTLWLMKNIWPPLIKKKHYIAFMLFPVTLLLKYDIYYWNDMAQTIFSLFKIDQKL